MRCVKCVAGKCPANVSCVSFLFFFFYFTCSVRTEEKSPACSLSLSQSSLVSSSRLVRVCTAEPVFNCIYLYTEQGTWEGERREWSISCRGNFIAATAPTAAAAATKPPEILSSIALFFFLPDGWAFLSLSLSFLILFTFFFSLFSTDPTETKFGHFWPNHGLQSTKSVRLCLSACPCGCPHLLIHPLSPQSAYAPTAHTQTNKQPTTARDYNFLMIWYSQLCSPS